MNKKILVLSQVPSHIPLVGNRRRIYTFLKSLKKLGYEIHFLYENVEKMSIYPQLVDVKAMKKSWDGVYLVRFNFPIFFTYIDSRIGLFGIFLKDNFPKLYNFLKKIKKNTNSKKKIDLDNLYNPYLDKIIKKLHKKEKFDIVLAGYAAQSKAFKLFDDSVIKIIDAYDALTNKNAEELSKILNYFSLFDKSEEARALNRADVVISIQDDEEKYFKSIVDKNKEVITVGHLLSENDIKEPIKRDTTRKNILFLGFTNPANKQGAEFFKEKVFPIIREKYPDSNFLIVGKVGKYFKSGEGVKVLGEIKELDKIYSLADVVISPLFFGTGLKIKNVEALAYGKPLVTTSFGMKGIEKGKNKAFLIADSSEEFVKQISKLFDDEKFYEKISNESIKFVKQYNSLNLKNLKKAFRYSK